MKSFDLTFNVSMGLLHLSISISLKRIPFMYLVNILSETSANYVINTAALDFTDLWWFAFLKAFIYLFVYLVIILFSLAFVLFTVFLFLILYIRHIETTEQMLVWTDV